MRSEVNDEGFKIYVGGLGSGADEREIEDAFKTFGRLKHVWVARQPAGFAFVVFEDERDAREAIRCLDGTLMNGRRVRVEFSTGECRWSKWKLDPPIEKKGVTVELRDLLIGGERKSSRSMDSYNDDRRRTRSRSSSSSTSSWSSSRTSPPIRRPHRWRSYGRLRSSRSSRSRGSPRNSRSSKSSSSGSSDWSGSSKTRTSCSSSGRSRSTSRNRSKWPRRKSSGSDWRSESRSTSIDDSRYCRKSGQDRNEGSSTEKRRGKRGKWQTEKPSKISLSDVTKRETFDGKTKGGEMRTSYETGRGKLPRADKTQLDVKMKFENETEEILGDARCPFADEMNVGVKICSPGGGERRRCSYHATSDVGWPSDPQESDEGKPLKFPTSENKSTGKAKDRNHSRCVSVGSNKIERETIKFPFRSIEAAFSGKQPRGHVTTTTLPALPSFGTSAPSSFTKPPSLSTSSSSSLPSSSLKSRSPPRDVIEKSAKNGSPRDPSSSSHVTSSLPGAFPLFPRPPSSSSAPSPSPPSEPSKPATSFKQSFVLAPRTSNSGGSDNNNNNNKDEQQQFNEASTTRQRILKRLKANAMKPIRVACWNSAWKNNRKRRRRESQ